MRCHFPQDVKNQFVVHVSWRAPKIQSSPHVAHYLHHSFSRWQNKSRQLSKIVRNISRERASHDGRGAGRPSSHSQTNEGWKNEREREGKDCLTGLSGGVRDLLLEYQRAPAKEKQNKIKKFIFINRAFLMMRLSLQHWWERERGREREWWSV